MPCGEALINAVASVLDPKGTSVSTIHMNLPAHYSRRAVRYAVLELIKRKQARRTGRKGPIYPVTNAK